MKERLNFQKKRCVAVIHNIVKICKVCITNSNTKYFRRFLEYKIEVFFNLWILLMCKLCNLNCVTLLFVWC